ncbi:hypothetical protein KUV59_03400 [Marinobacter daepoensis]|uniref:hypothetical protein n=1 Tax=Marinobacter daepoensis TaxID=262077 RepID=UPI001C98DFCE|nr:hypothetical protein [Marinobacter daepoensis]MBY6032200.1 hypothetical protein [Marinobacter daepoensis]
MTLETAKALLDTLIFAVEQMATLDDYRVVLLMTEVIQAIAGLGKETFLNFLYQLQEICP